MRRRPDRLEMAAIGCSVFLAAALCGLVVGCSAAALG